MGITYHMTLINNYHCDFIASLGCDQLVYHRIASLNRTDDDVCIGKIPSSN